MFDIGFTELLMIGVVTLVVFGPERLPGLARSAGFWIGRMRRTVNDLKQEFKQELHNADVMAREDELQREFDQRSIGARQEPASAVSKPVPPSHAALSAHSSAEASDDRK